MNREEFLEELKVIKEEPLCTSDTLITVSDEEKKLLSGGLYFLQEFFKNRLEKSEQFQKILQFEYQNGEIVDEEMNLGDLYGLEVRLYDRFFERFPSAKEETDYFVIEGNGSGATGDASDPESPIWHFGFNYIPWSFIIENDDDFIDAKIDAEIHRIFHQTTNELATMTLYRLSPNGLEEMKEIITFIYK